VATPGIGLANRPDGACLLQDRRILVVEDEALVSMMIEDQLLAEGAEVIGPAGTLEDALALVDQALGTAGDGLSAAVLDINLHGRMVTPVADRLVACRVPFLFITGYGETGYGEGQGLRGRAAAPVLEKPFDPDRLLRIVLQLASPDA
jgi:DNA-binding response OmpR family regulator